MNTKYLFLLIMTLLNLVGQNALANESESPATGDVRTFHCSLLVDGDVFGHSPSRQLGFDVNEGEAIALEDGWRVSIYVSGGAFTSGSLLFATVAKASRGRNVLTVAAEPGSRVLAGVANVWSGELPSGSGSSSVYLTCSADHAREISPDRP